MQKLTMSLPWRASAFTSASTTKAFSVPRLAARLLMAGINGFRIDFFLRLEIVTGVPCAAKSRSGPFMLVNCVAYEDGRKLADIELRAIHAYLTRPGCFVWVALKEASAAELEEMRSQFNLHPL